MLDQKLRMSVIGPKGREERAIDRLEIDDETFIGRALGPRLVPELDPGEEAFEAIDGSVMVVRTSIR